MNITANLAPDLSNYTQRDYRRFLSAHLQFLIGLCKLSKTSVNTFINQLLSSLFITTHLSSSSNFHAQINSFVQDSKSSAPSTLTRLLSLIRLINDGNAIVSNYGTNFDYFLSQIPQIHQEYIMYTEAIVYDDNCSCRLNASCTVSAAFYEKDSWNPVFLRGLKMGCTPRESFLFSTLECFYDLSCVKLIQDYAGLSESNNSTSTIMHYAMNESRFLRNTTIINLLNEVFIEQWSISINYSSYFDQCSPSLCSYTYIQKFNILYIITRLLGLYGGLSLVLKWICPMVVSFVAKQYQRWKKSTNSVEPVFIIHRVNVKTTTVVSTCTDVHGNQNNGVLSPKISKYRYTD